MTYWLQPANIYEYPTVEYIPVFVERLQGSETPSDNGVQLIVCHDAAEFNEWASRLQLPPLPPQNLDFEANVVLIAVGADVQECNYRAYKATLVGERKPGLRQVLQITRRYFYKDQIQFALYDRQGSFLASTWTRVSPIGVAR